MEKELKYSLFALRISVFLVMFMWTIDKFVNPDHTARVFSYFYMIGNMTATLAYLIGAIQMLIILAFVIGFQKKWSYLLVLIMHGVSTLSSYMKYLDPWSNANLLFFAAFPMLAACYSLYKLRDHDKFLTF